MDRGEEKLTVENIDEQIERYLSQPRTSLSENVPSVMRAVHDLQSIYAENRRLEQAWARINSRASALNAASNATSEELSAAGIAQEEKEVIPTEKKPVMLRAGKRSKQSFRWNWRVVGIGLVAAILLFAILGWPIVSYALYGTPIGIIQPFMPKGTPRSQPTVNVSDMKEYSSQYFTIQYPSNWVVTHVRTGSSYLQTVQFRPLTTSAVFVNVNVLPNSGSSANQLLRMDPDVKMGTGLRTSSATYHGIPWTIGAVDLPGPSHTQAGKLEVAYSHQGIPYRIEFGATSDEFDAYTPVFNTMFASFQAQAMPVVSSTATPKGPATPVATPTSPATPVVTSTSQATPVATPSPVINIPGIKVYSSQYFTIQYPSNWVVTNVSTGGAYQQTVQFRPLTTSAVSVNVNVMYHSDLSSDLLLLTDPDVKIGTGLRTSSVIDHGIPWKVGIVNILDAGLNPSREVEVAYSNQNAPYKIELSTPPGMFNSYTQSFNTMLASFYPAT